MSNRKSRRKKPSHSRARQVPPTKRGSDPQRSAQSAAQRQLHVIMFVAVFAAVAFALYRIFGMANTHAYAAMTRLIVALVLIIVLVILALYIATRNKH